MKRELIYKGIRYLIYIILLAGLFVLIRNASLLSIDGHHDGTVYNPANIVAKGGVLFKDTSTYYGPLLVYIQALFLRIFGNNLASMRLSAVVFYVIAFLLYFHIFKRIMPRYMVIFSEAALLFIAPFWMTTFHAWSSVYTLVTTLGLIYFSILYIEKEKLSYIAAAGACCTWTFLIRTPVGCVFLLASLVMWAILSFFRKERKRYRCILAFITGFFAGLLPFLILFTAQGTLAAWWNDCILYTLRMLGRLMGTKAESMGMAFYEIATACILPQGISAMIAVPQGIARLWADLFPVDGSGIYIILPVATLILFFNQIYTIYCTRREGKDALQWKESIILLIILWFSLASWHQYYGVSEVRHWYWGGFPMVGALTYLLYFLCRQFKGKWQAAVAILLLFTLSATTMYERYAYYSERKQKYVYRMDEQTSPELEGIYLSAEQSQFYIDYCDLIRSLRSTHPDRYIQNDTFCILLSSLNHNDQDMIDMDKTPIIVSNSNNVEDYPGFFMAVELVQDYPEQELDRQRFKIRIWLPYDW